MKNQSKLGRVDYVRFSLNPEEESLFLMDYQLAVSRLEQCEECLGYELGRARTPGHFLMRVEWGGASEHWPLTEQPTALRQFLFSLKTSLKMVAEVTAYSPVNVPCAIPAERKPMAAHQEMRKSA